MELYDLDKAKTFLISQKALIVEGGRLLLLNDVSRAQWELPGGLLEMGEDLAAGLKREVCEEIGYEIAPGHPIAIDDAWVKNFRFRDGRSLDIRVIVITYVCTKIGGTARLSDEHTDHIWADLASLDGLNLAPECATAVKAYLATGAK